MRGWLMNKETRNKIKAKMIEKKFSTRQISLLSDFINENVDGVEVTFFSHSDVCSFDSLRILKQLSQEA